MRANLALNKSWRFTVIGIVACGISLVSCNFFVHKPLTTLPTTWTIKVDVTSGATTPQYSATTNILASQNGCSYATGPISDASTLQICSNDMVNWQGNSTGQKHELVVFMSDEILNDSSGSGAKTKSTFPASDGNPTPLGYVSPTADKLKYHEWYVVLYDKQNQKAHYGDPKIKIGH